MAASKMKADKFGTWSTWHLEGEDMAGNTPFPRNGLIQAVQVDNETGGELARLPVGFTIQGIFVPLGRP